MVRNHRGLPEPKTRCQDTAKAVVNQFCQMRPIDNRWPYNVNLFRPQPYGCLVFGRA